MEPTATTIECTGTCTVALTVDSVPLTEEKTADLVTLFWGFVLAAVLVWGMKALLRLFTHDTND